MKKEKLNRNVKTFVKNFKNELKFRKNWAISNYNKFVYNLNNYIQFQICEISSFFLASKCSSPQVEIAHIFIKNTY